MQPLIGIIGGMGSFSGLYLLSYALRRGRHESDEEFPRILYYNLPVQGMDKTGVSDERLLFKQLRAAVAHMSAFGCEQIIIGCNSAHTLWAKLQGMTPNTIVNMVGLAAHTCLDKGKIGILCSQSSKSARLYPKELDGYEIEYVETDGSEQEQLNLIIENVIADRTWGLFETLRVVCDCLRSRGADTILFGCTELEACVPQGFSEVFPVILPGRLAVDYCLDSCGQLSVHHG